MKKCLASELLINELVDVGAQGATDIELSSLPPLPPELRELLQWHNGFDLDVVRIHGVGQATRSVERSENGKIIFASDPAGFVYSLRVDGAVVSVDHDGGSEKVVARDIVDLFRGFVFGKRAAEFAGSAWANQVAIARLDS